MLCAINPATGETLQEYRSFDASTVSARLAAAARTFSEWRATPFAERARLMKAAAANLREKTRDYAELMSDEMGKPIRQALGEVEKCAWVCDFYAEQAESFLATRTIETDAQASFVRYDPLGPVLAIMPWNFPFWQVFRFAAPAVMAGNVGLLKHASNVPGCALAIESVFSEAGFPAGVFSTLLVSAKEIETIIAHPSIQAVTLTGSEAAGIAVAAAAGKELKKTVLELGGSDPFIVLADADIEQAAQGAARARCQNTGQSCIAAKRFIVEEPIAEAFTEAFVAELESLKMGDPREEETDIGPLAREDLRDALHDQVTRSLEQGARLRLGGKIPERQGAYYPPTLLDRTQPEMPVFKEETFGPVAAVIAVRDVEQAIELANQSCYGLGASIWSKNGQRGLDMAARIEAGCVFINGMVKSDPRLPFGGIKRSGYGRELSDYGIREFVNIKTVWLG